MTTDLCFLNATEQAAGIRRGDFSSVELTGAHIAQIERVNPAVNAVVTFLPQQALERARAADDALAKGEDVGPLHGLPMLHKDTTDTAGIRTTYGSPIHRDNVPAQSQLIIERLHAAGAIPMGKTNVPEFGAGSQSFNPVFGATGNPYDPTTTCGGSSGGQAVALACGMTPIADGSDMGGSLRNPANFCNVVGFRLSPGRVPVWPSLTGWSALSVQGPDGAYRRRRGAAPHRHRRARTTAHPSRCPSRAPSSPARSRAISAACASLTAPIWAQRSRSIRASPPPSKRSCRPSNSSAAN